MYAQFDGCSDVPPPLDTSSQRGIIAIFLFFFFFFFPLSLAEKQTWILLSNISIFIFFSFFPFFFSFFFLSSSTSLLILFWLSVRFNSFSSLLPIHFFVFLGFSLILALFLVWFLEPDFDTYTFYFILLSIHIYAMAKVDKRREDLIVS